MRRLLTFSVLSRVLGLVLLTAGGLKAYDGLANGPTLESEGLAQWALVAATAFEVIFGIWLVVGLHPRLSWWLATGCFVVLLGASFDKAMSGQTVCGCFGRVPLHPWVTFAFDAAALFALLYAQPFGEPAARRALALRRWAAFAGLSLCALAGLAATWYWPQARLDEDGEIVGTGGQVQLHPKDWVGHRFPLGKHIDIGAQLGQGRWAVMFYRADCSDCRTAIPRYVGLAYHLSSQTGATRFALVEVPPYAAPEVSSSGQSSVCVRGRLAATRQWQLETPNYVLLDGGTVTKTTDTLGRLIDELRINPEVDSAKEGFLFPDYRQIRRQMFLREIACGPLALIALLQELGKPLSQEDADRLLAEAGDTGIDLLRLRELAQQHGLHALGVAVSPEKLRTMGQRAIVHLNGVGFVPVTGYTKEGIALAYPLEPPGILPDDLFAKAFGTQGRALLVSDSPLDPGRLGLRPAESGEPKPQGPRLQLSRSVVAVGRIHRKHWETSITLTNDGGAPLKIYGVSTTCPCFTASVGQKQLAPGESTLLRAKGTQAQLGGFTYAVVLRTNETGNSPAQVPVRGYAEHPVAFSRPAVRLLGVLPNQQASAEVDLELPAGLDLARLKLKAPEKGPLTAELRRTVSGVAVFVRWHGADKPGWYRAELQVFAESSADAIGTPLPCAVEVVPEIVVSPPSLLIDGETPGTKWARRLVIESKHPLAGDPSVRWSDRAAGDVIRVGVTKRGDRSLEVELIGKRADVRRFNGRRINLTLVVAPDRAVSVPLEFTTTRKK